MTSHAVIDLGKALFPIFALALDLNEDFFADKVYPFDPGIEDSCADRLYARSLDQRRSCAYYTTRLKEAVLMIGYKASAHIQSAYARISHPVLLMITFSQVMRRA